MIKNKKDFDIVNITQKFTGVEKGVSTSLDSSMARPFRVLIEEGKNTGNINHVFFKDLKYNYVVGSLCYSKTKRLIFFPGIISRKLLWDSDKGDINDSGIVDHLTIEPNLKNWHITIFNNGEKDITKNLSNRSLHKIEDGLYYWFGLSVSSSNMFEKLLEEYSLSFEIPSDQSKKYNEILLKSKDGAKFHFLSLIEEGIKEDEFLHFDFIIDLRDKNLREKIPHNVTFVPTKPPTTTTELFQVDNFIIRAHPVEIPEFSGVVTILVSKHKGKLTKDVFIGSAPELTDNK